MARLALFQPDPVAMARARSALAEQHELVLCADWPALLGTLGGDDGGAADGCVLDLYHPEQPVELDAVAQLRERHPELAIVVYADFSGRHMDLVALGGLQVDGVIAAEGNETAPQIREAVEAAQVSALTTRVVRAVESRLPSLALNCLRWAIENGHDAQSAEELARAFARSSASLSRTLQKDGAPPVGRLLLWGRLFRAAHMIEQAGATVEEVALTLGYSGREALSRALERATGYGPRELRQRGGVGCALGGFIERECGALPGSVHRSSPPAGLALLDQRR